MYAGLRSAARRINWRAWSVALSTSSILTHSTLALCDNNNINDNHLTPFLTKEITPDEFVTQSPANADIHLKSFQKPDNSFLEWGLHSTSKSPKQTKFFDEIQIKSIRFSSNVQIVLDIDGRLYCKYNNDDWVNVSGFNKIHDIAITNDVLFLIDTKGRLYQLQYHSLANKYHDPCVDKCIKNPEICAKSQLEKDIQNCKDHRRKRSFSSMPISGYRRYLKSEYPWTSSSEFADFLTSSYSNNTFELIDIKHKTYSERMSKVYANDYRVFALSNTGNVYVRGDNQRGACGINNDLYIGDFTQIGDKYFDAPIIDIGIGEDHTLFLSKLGRIFSCGSDNLMQLGLGWTKRKCIKSDVNWSEIGENGFVHTAESFDRNVEIEDDKDVEYFHEIPSYDEFYPRVITGPFFDDYKVISIACGDYHSAAIIEPLYSLKNPLKRQNREIPHMSDKEILDLKRELVENRRVVTWGCGLYGQLGHCNFTNASEPKPVKPLEQYKEFNQEIDDIMRIKPVAIKCGKEHTVVLMEGYGTKYNDGYDHEVNKMVFAFGNNRYNQVSKKKKPKQSSPHWIQSLLPQRVSIDMIAAGNFQSAAFGQSQQTQFQF